MTKCNSCTNGYNGKNGSGYQPCGCPKHTPQRQGDEYYCARCGVRWGLKDDPPEKCVKAKPPKLL